MRASASRGSDGSARAPAPAAPPRSRAPARALGETDDPKASARGVEPEDEATSRAAPRIPHAAGRRRWPRSAPRLPPAARTRPALALVSRRASRPRRGAGARSRRTCRSAAWGANAIGRGLQHLQQPRAPALPHRDADALARQRERHGKGSVRLLGNAVALRAEARDDEFARLIHRAPPRAGTPRFPSRRGSARDAPSRRQPGSAAIRRKRSRPLPAAAPHPARCRPGRCLRGPPRTAA